MKKEPSWRITPSLAVVVLLSAFWVLPGQSDASTVTELDFTGGSVALKNSSGNTVLSSNFTTNGQIVMGQYQPLPDIIAPVPLGPIPSRCLREVRIPCPPAARSARPSPPI